MKKIAIHQPNFFPWLGYFDKIVKSDIFVFLDDVQAVKTGSSWFNRVKISGAGGGEWLTVSIKRPSGFQIIKDAEIVDYEKSFDKIKNILKSRYKGHSFFNEVFYFVNELISSSKNSNLCDFNIFTITEICKRMSLRDDHFVKASTLNVSTVGTQRLVDITKACQANIYINGGGSSEYFEEAIFQNSGLSVRQQNFVTYEYSQLKKTEFVPGLSILDLLMNVGFQEAGRIVLSKK